MCVEVMYQKWNKLLPSTCQVSHRFQHDLESILNVPLQLVCSWKEGIIFANVSMEDVGCNFLKVG